MNYLWLATGIISPLHVNSNNLFFLKIIPKALKVLEQQAILICFWSHTQMSLLFNTEDVK